MVKSIWPVSVYFTAFVSKFKMICLIFPISPRKIPGKSLVIFKLKSIGLFPILGVINFPNDSNTSLGLYSFSMISILFASILEISKIPFTISSRFSEASTTSLANSFVSFKSVEESIHSLNPTIAFSGVLIS